MRRPPFHHNRSRRLEVEMTPMIDVIFLLLIYFVCTTSFQPKAEQSEAERILAAQMSIAGAVPSEVQVDRLKEDLGEIVVKVLWRAGRPKWEIDGRKYDHLTRLEDLQNAGNVEAALRGVQRGHSDVPVILDVESAVPMQNVIDVYDLCRAVGLE